VIDRVVCVADYSNIESMQYFTTLDPQSVALLFSSPAVDSVVAVNNNIETLVSEKYENL